MELSPHPVSGAPARRTRLDPDARYAQLLSHAVAAFADAGIERAVHANVAERAGVSTPTVFKYFPTRDDLVNAVLDRIEAVITELLNHIPENAQMPPGDLAQRLATALDKLCVEQPDLMKVTLMWSVAFSSVRDRYLTFHNEKLEMMQRRIQSTRTDHSDARILIGAALLFIRMHFDGTSEDVRRRYVDRMRELFDAETGTQPA